MQPNFFIYYVYVQIMFTFIHSFITLFHSLWTIPTITNYNETDLKLAKLGQYLKESERIRLFAYFWRCTNDINSNEDSKNVHVQTIGPWVGGVVDYKCAKSSHQNKNGKLLKLVDTLINGTTLNAFLFLLFKFVCWRKVKTLRWKRWLQTKHMDICNHNDTPSRLWIDTLCTSVHMKRNEYTLHQTSATNFQVLN